jgi:hypothetical protein
MKCYSSLIAIAAILYAASSSSAALLLDDDFGDLSRTETNLPDESHFFLSHPDANTMLANTLRYQIQSGSTKAHTYFSLGSQYSELEVGDTLSAAVTIIPRVSLNPGNSTSRNFRFGLFRDPTDGHVLADTNDDGGGDGDPWTDAQGYGVQIAMMSDANTRTPFDLGKRVGSDDSLLGTSGDYIKTSGGTPVVMAINNEYTYTMDISKITDTQTDITVSLSQTGVGLLSTYTVSDNGSALGAAAPYDRFDLLGFRWSNAETTASIFDFKSIVITGPALVPEPASLAMLGLSAALCVLRRQR